MLHAGIDAEIGMEESPGAIDNPAPCPCILYLAILTFTVCSWMLHAGAGAENGMEESPEAMESCVPCPCILYLAALTFLCVLVDAACRNRCRDWNGEVT